MTYDIAIIGAGIVGSCIARELSKYKLNVCMIEKADDVSCGTSKANSGIIHAGYDPVPESLMAKLNVQGTAMYEQLSQELHFDYKKIGSLVVAFNEEDLSHIQKLYERGTANGVQNMKIINQDELRELEPNINEEALGALYAPTAGIIDPFNLVVHTVENAVDNGVKLFLNEEVINIEYSDELTKVFTKNNVYEAKMVVDAAGLASDKIAQMVTEIDWKITPRKGQYFVLDHYKVGLVNSVIFPLPSEKGKGILVSKTTSNNYIVGPSSELVDDINDLSTDSATLAKSFNFCILCSSSYSF